MDKDNSGWGIFFIGLFVGVCVTAAIIDAIPQEIKASSLIVPDMKITVTEGISDTTFIYTEQ